MNGKLAWSALVVAAIVLLLTNITPISSAQGPTWPNRPPFGVDMRGTITDAQGLADAVEAGVQWMRIKVSWDTVEPIRTNPPTYNWAFYDQIFQNAANAGISLVVTIRDNPAWAAPTRCGPLYDSSELARFASALVSRYSAPPYRVRVWELYNEPDNTRADGWFLNLGGCWGNQGNAYANMLKVVYPAMKAADPNAIVLIGALGFEWELVSHLNPNFLRDVLQAGGGAFFDAMNFHYFHEYERSWYDPYVTRGLQNKMNTLKNILSSYGFNKPFVITELGHPYAGPPSEGYTQKSNTRYVIKGNVQAISRDVKIIIWYQMKDGPEDARLYGLLNTQGTRQPGYNVFSLLIRELEGFTYAGRFNEAVWGLEAHRFQKPGHTKLIAWCSHEGIIETDVPWAMIRLTTRTCNESTCTPFAASVVQDGSAGDRDGRVNGSIRLRLDADPVFIEPVTPTPTPSPTSTPTITPTPTSTPTPRPGARITGIVWNDSDANGVRDDGEGGLSDVRLILQRLTGTGDDQEAFTASDGSYSFSGLAAGGYRLNCEAPAGYSGTTSLIHELELIETSHVVVNFGLRAYAGVRLPLIVRN